MATDEPVTSRREDIVGRVQEVVMHMLIMNINCVMNKSDVVAWVLVLLTLNPLAFEDIGDKRVNLT